MKLIDGSQLGAIGWDASLADRPDANFLQSWAWGEFHKALDNKVWRLAIEDNGMIALQLLVIKLSLGLGQCILYSPRGSLINKKASARAVKDGTALLITRIQEIAHQENALAFRMDPPITEDDQVSISIYKSLGFIPNPRKQIQPKLSQVLDLTDGYESILKEMKPKTRYNINLARKKELVITNDVSPESIHAFVELTTITANRNKFKSHSPKYYETQIKTLSQYNMISLWIAKIENTPIAAILIVTFGPMAVYVHGSSNDTYRNLMAPYLLHDLAIKDAIDNGVTYYDFGGITSDPDHPWAGITRFKKGFGGEEVKYITTQELPTNTLLYNAYRFMDQVR